MMLSYRSATIDFSHSLEFSGSQGYNRQARIRLFLYNSGRVMAKNPFLRITYVKVPSQATPTHIRFRRSGSTVTYFLNKEPLLHAHERAEATNFNLHMTPLIDDMRAAPKARNNKPWLSDDNWVLTGRRVQNNNFSEIDIRTKKSFSFIAEYGAENCILRKEEIEITSDKILKILDSKDQLEIFPQIIF